LNSYQIEGQLLIIKEISTGNIEWQGKFYNCPITKVIPVSDPIGCIVLLDYYEFNKTANCSKGNLIFVNPNGELIWSAELPSTSDAYVDFKVDQRLSANSWNGFFVQIDLTNGKIVDKNFSK
jgi:hypothetical protein